VLVVSGRVEDGDADQTRTVDCIGKEILLAIEFLFQDRERNCTIWVKDLTHKPHLRRLDGILAWK
jgi:hypothetical protein